MISCKTFLACAFSLIILTIAGCAATETHQKIDVKKVDSASEKYLGAKAGIMVGNFQNRSNYMQGLFSSNTNRLGNQAKTILKTHLQQTNRFNVMDRENMTEISEEAKLLGVKQQLKGAQYAITGDVTEFGRKVTGDKQLFGILGKGKKQVAYAKVSLNIVDVLSSQIVYSVQGAGEYALSNREVVGFGGTAGYDATLNGKVLNFAIQEAVNNMVNDIKAGVWVPRTQ